MPKLIVTDRAPKPNRQSGKIAKGDDIPWRERRLQTMQTAAEIADVSVASLYRFAGEGRLMLRRLAGRTLVETASLVALIESAEKWVPSNRGMQARAKRSERARATWRA